MGGGFGGQTWNKSNNLRFSVGLGTGSDGRTDLNFELLSHISPIGWDNVLLYGEYQLNRSLVRSERLSVSMIDKPPVPSVPEESRAGRRRGKR